MRISSIFHLISESTFKVDLVLISDCNSSLILFIIVDQPIQSSFRYIPTEEQVRIKDKVLIATNHILVTQKTFKIVKLKKELMYLQKIPLDEIFCSLVRDHQEIPQVLFVFPLGKRGEGVQTSENTKPEIKPEENWGGGNNLGKITLFKTNQVSKHNSLYFSIIKFFFICISKIF